MVRLTTMRRVSFKLHRCAKKRPERRVKKMYNRYLKIVTGLAKLARELRMRHPITLSSIFKLRSVLTRVTISNQGSSTTMLTPSSFTYFSLSLPSSSPTFSPVQFSALNPGPPTAQDPAQSSPTPILASAGPSSTEPAGAHLSDVRDSELAGTTSGHLPELISFKSVTKVSTFISVNRAIKNLCKDFQNKACPYPSGHFSWFGQEYVDHYCKICYTISGGVCLDHSKLDCKFYKRSNFGKGKGKNFKKW